MKKFDKTRPLSWSAIASFEYDKEQWYEKYILGKKPEDNKEMVFGREFAKSIEDGVCDKKYNIELLPLLQKKKEHPFHVVFSGIPLIGFADAFDDKNFKILDEVKTGKREWDQKRADEHRQIDMYLLMNLITNKIKPEDVVSTIRWVPTQENGDFSISLVQPAKVHSFITKRTTAQILKFGAYIQQIYKEMELYAATHP